jgi:hypothetical protein
MIQGAPRRVSLSPAPAGLFLCALASRLPVNRHRNCPGVALGSFDLDDIGAEIAEHLGSSWAIVPVTWVRMRAQPITARFGAVF